MTYLVSASAFRLGFSISWSVINSPLYFDKGYRLSIMLNCYLRGLLKMFRIKLVKWFFNVEAYNIRLVVIVLYKTNYYYNKIRYRKKKFKFSYWNKIYFDRDTWYLKQLKNYYSSSIYLPKVNLGSGRLWHKHFKTIFFKLGKNKGLHKVKVYKIRRKIVEELCFNRTFDVILKKNIQIFRIKKIANFPVLQVMHRFYFKLLNVLFKKLNNSSSIYLKNKNIFIFKINFLKLIFYLNYFIKRLKNFKNSFYVRRLFSFFENSSNIYYNFFFIKRMPRKEFDFDQFNYIVSTDEGWREAGSISFFKLLVKNFNTVWQSLFVYGVYSKNSFKRYLRRQFLNFLDKTKQRVLLIKYFLKNIIFNRKLNKKIKFFSKNQFFFNSKFVSRLNNMYIFILNFKKKKLVNYKNFLFFDIFQKIKIKKFHTISTFKLSKYLTEGDFFYNDKANEFVNDKKLFRRNVWYFKSMRLKFFNKIKYNLLKNPKCLINFLRLDLLKFKFLKYFYIKVFFDKVFSLVKSQNDNLMLFNNGILLDSNNEESINKEKENFEEKNFYNLVIFELGNSILIHYIMNLLLNFKLKFLIGFLLNKIRLIYFFEIYKLYIFNYKIQNIFNIYKRSKNNSLIYLRVKYNKFLSKNLSFFNVKFIRLKVLTIFSILNIFGYFFLTMYKYSNNYFGVHNKKKYLLFLFMYFKKVSFVLQKFDIFSKEFKKFNIFNKINRLKNNYLLFLIYFFLKVRYFEDFNKLKKKFFSISKLYFIKKKLGKKKKFYIKNLVFNYNDPFLDRYDFLKYEISKWYDTNALVKIKFFGKVIKEREDRLKRNFLVKRKLVYFWSKNKFDFNIKISKFFRSFFFSRNGRRNKYKFNIKKKRLFFNYLIKNKLIKKDIILSNKSFLRKRINFFIKRKFLYKNLINFFLFFRKFKIFDDFNYLCDFEIFKRMFDLKNDSKLRYNYFFSWFSNNRVSRFIWFSLFFRDEWFKNFFIRASRYKVFKEHWKNRFSSSKKNISKFFRINRNLPEAENFIEFIKLINYHRLNFIYRFNEFDIVSKFKEFEKINFKNIEILSKKNRYDKISIFDKFKEGKRYKSFIFSKKFDNLFNNEENVLARQYLQRKSKFFYKKQRTTKFNNRHKNKNFNKFKENNSINFIDNSKNMEKTVKLSRFNEFTFKIVMFLKSRIRKKLLRKKNFFLKKINSLEFNYFKYLILKNRKKMQPLFNSYVELILKQKKYPIGFSKKLSYRNKMKGKTSYLMRVFNEEITTEDLIAEKRNKFFNRKYFSKYYLPTKNRSKVRNLFFPKMVRKKFFNLSRWIKSCFIRYKFSKVKWINILFKWNNFKNLINSKNFLYLSNNNVYSYHDKYLFLINRIYKFKQKRRWVNNWKITRLFFFNKFYLKRRRSKVIKRRNRRFLGKEFENRTIGFPYSFDRTIKWWRYKLFFNKNLSMQFRSTSRFLVRYRKKRMNKMSSISKLQNLNNLLNKMLVYIISTFKSKYLHLKFFLKLGYDKNLNKLNKYIISNADKFDTEKKMNYVIILLNILFLLRFKVNILNNFFFIIRYLFQFIFFFSNFFKLNFFNSIKHSNGKRLNFVIKFIYSFFVLNFFDINRFFKFQIEKEKQSIKNTIYSSMYERRFSGKVWKLIYSTKLFNILNKNSFNIYSVFYIDLLLKLDSNFLFFLENYISENLQFLYNVLTNSKNIKKIVYFDFYLHKVSNFKLLILILDKSNNTNLNFFNLKKIKNFSIKRKIKKIVFYYKSNMLFLNQIQRIKNFYFLTINNYSIKNWIKNKKFLFWLEQELEKDLKRNTSLNIIKVALSFMKMYRFKVIIFFNLIRLISKYRVMGGYRQQTIYTDFLWIVFISVKYFCSSFMIDMISEQLIKRKKQWGFIKRLRSTINEVLPFYFSNPRIIDSIRISINGKINGKNRSSNFLMYKYYKDKQIAKIYWMILKVDYAVIQAKSKYGSFGIRIWLSRI